MNSKSGGISYLNGERFRRALISGSKRVIARHDHLNKINVFPVMDSDTGTNISLTLSASLKAVALEEENTLPKVMEAFADGTLEAARGNSGTIFAQWFQGLYDATEQYEQLSTRQFIEAFSASADHAYKAVAEPVEGTILTVLRETAQALNKLKSPPSDYAALFDVLLKEANKSLNDTPKKLKILKKHGVVDAGAQAMVDFFEGISHFIHHGDIKGLDEEIAKIVESELEEDCAHAGTEDIEDYTYRYCTECVIVANNIDQDKLKREVHVLGDSLVIAGSRRKVKIHMHVNQPAQLFRICRTFGKVKNDKAEDMFHQIKDAHAKHSDVAIVTDSALDLPQSIMDSLNIHIIPIRIHVGDDAFIDRLSISPDEFYEIIERDGVIPKTAHPTYRDFKARYQFLTTHYKAIISIHITSVMSNTIGAAQLVQRDLDFKNLAVVDSNNVSVGQGLLVQYAGELANAGHSYQDILDKLDIAKSKTTLYALLGNLDYAVKGGRVPGFVKRIADWFRLQPMLDISKGKKPKICGVIRSKKGITRIFARRVLAKLDPNKKYRIAVGHCQAPDEGQKLLELLTLKSKSIQSSYLVGLGVTIGSHTGPGTLGVAILECD